MVAIAVLSEKGGCGKTTLAINVAAAAHLAGHKTILVDLDTQASAYAWSMARPDGSKLDGLAVVRADRLTRPRFREITEGRDISILDGPPRIGEVTRAAAAVADVVLVPVQPGPFDFWAASDTWGALDQADAIRAELGLPPVRRVFVLNRAIGRSALAREAPAILAEQGEVLGVVGQRVAFASAAASGESVLTSGEDAQARAEIEALYRRLMEVTPPQPADAAASKPATKARTKKRKAS